MILWGLLGLFGDFGLLRTKYIPLLGIGAVEFGGLSPGTHIRQVSGFGVWNQALNDGFDRLAMMVPHVICL